MPNGGTPLLPQAIDLRPNEHKTCSIMDTTVVLPFVPVTEIIGFLQRSLNISISVDIDISLS